MRNITLKEALLPQPPSFIKKKNYDVQNDVHQVLGTGTFGKVMVRDWLYSRFGKPCPRVIWCNGKYEKIEKIEKSRLGLFVTFLSV